MALTDTDSLRADALAQIEQAETLDTLEAARIAFLGKQGSIVHWSW